MKKIDYLGFGSVDRAILSNTELDIYAKAVYVYLCVYRDKKTGIAFPSMRTICRNLGICRNTATKAIRKLEEFRIIEKIFRAYWGYKYKINRNTSAGYGTVPKAVMLDARLSIQSKAIYALLCVFAGKNENAFPRTKTICKLLKIGRSTYSKYIKELVDCNYVKRVQQKINGKFSSNLYTLSKYIDIRNISDKKAYAGIIKEVCADYRLSPAPIEYFSKKLYNVIKKLGISHIHRVESYIKIMVKNYMHKNGLQIPKDSMTEDEIINHKRALLRWQIENYDFLKAETIS